jgi:hypothetical protein
MKPLPSSIQSTTSPFTVPLKLSTKQLMQRQEQRHISLGRGQTIDAITHGGRHRLHQDNHPRITTYYADSTLYPIPEHGSGVCYMRYTTRYKHIKRIAFGRLMSSILNLHIIVAFLPKSIILVSSKLESETEPMAA